jgi:hypothetical protein
LYRSKEKNEEEVPQFLSLPMNHRKLKFMMQSIFWALKKGASQKIHILQGFHISKQNKVVRNRKDKEKTSPAHEVWKRRRLKTVALV